MVFPARRTEVKRSRLEASPSSPIPLRVATQRGYVELCIAVEYLLQFLSQLSALLRPLLGRDASPRSR